ncbi:MAG TPA: ABC transporter permease, partial [Pseudomonadales bacterium]|nr:ABC transporter permease [Pseudomonadales bacterium]
RFTLRVGNIDYQTTVTGVNSKMPYVRDWPVEEGNFFTDRDFSSFAPVIVLGKTVVKNLFPDGSNPIGKYVLVKNIPFEVIGVLSGKGAMGWGGDQDDNSFVPLSTGLIRLFGKSYLNGITVKVSSVDTIQETEDALRNLLISRHRTEDFMIRDMASLLDTVSETQDTLTILLAVVAAISLLVGGIGVMNIMLVSVTERTREIGIRMATGARARDILLQFNTEAAVVCTVGGGIGLAAGFLVGFIIRLFGVPVLFSPGPAIIAFSCAFLTSVIFGYLPARKAAMMDPVVALAAE